MKFLEDPYIRENAIRMLASDSSEKTFNIAGELFNVNLINGIPTNYDIHMKIVHIWSTYDKVTRLAYC